LTKERNSVSEWESETLFQRNWKNSASFRGGEIIIRTR